MNRVVTVKLDGQDREFPRGGDDYNNLVVGIRADAARVWLKSHHVVLQGGDEFADRLRAVVGDAVELERVSLDALAEYIARTPGAMFQFLSHYRREFAEEVRGSLMAEVADQF